jgi:hypothetical protein
MYSSIVEDLRRDKVALIARVAALQKDIEEMRKDHAEALQDMRSRHQQKFLEATVTIRNKHSMQCVSEPCDGIEECLRKFKN